jgi:4-oxalocrotonate tautomerase
MNMPLITVSMYPGRTEKQKEEYAKAITKSAVEILKTKESHVIVVFEENPKENWYMAGNPL